MAADPGAATDGGEPPVLRRVETLGVTDVVVSILQARKSRPWATAAAVWRWRRDAAVYVRVILIEHASAPGPDDGRQEPEGRTEVIGEFAAGRLGADLITAFGAKDVIVLS